MPKSKSAPNGAKHRKHRPAITPEAGAYKLKPAAEYLGGLSIMTMHRLCERGLLKPNRKLRHLLFPKSELDRFLMS